jgi:hypothetical protein
MIAYQYEYKVRLKGDGKHDPKQDISRIVVVPAQAKHAQGIVAIDEAAYFSDADDPYTSDAIEKQFLSQIAVFPEGQFVAIDVDTNQVVGRTASMRYHYDPTRSLLESWAASTGDG